MTALAGGVGAARMLAGLSAAVGQASITAIVNTGDDVVMHGLHISPDIDTVTYTLAGVANGAMGWGLADESWAVMSALRQFEAVSPRGPGSLTWFSLGDHDLATHLYRTGRLAEGATLSQVTAEVASRYGVQANLLPMTNEPVRTMVTLAGPASSHQAGSEIGFQEYFVGLRHSVPLRSVRFAGAGAAVAAPGVLRAVAEADLLLICPSNPIVSIGPVLAVPGVLGAVQARRATTVAVSPIVAGRALKGPADRMLNELGSEASVEGVAKLWCSVASTLVVDEADAEHRSAVEATGMRCVVAPTIMTGPDEAEALGRAVAACLT